jgi:hypothetical protein
VFFKEHENSTSPKDEYYLRFLKINNACSEIIQILGTGHYLWQGWGPKRKYNAAGKIITPPFSKQNF